MHKKQFIALADAIKQHNEEFSRPDNSAERFFDAQLATLADFCASQNGQFNRERWLGYIAGECGPNGGVIRKDRAA
jgi:hypothetical protein